MFKCCCFLLLVLVASITDGQERENPGEQFLKPEFEVGPKPLNGYKTSVTLASWDEGEANNDKQRLYIYIEVSKELLIVSYEELKIEVLDEKGKAVEQFPTETNEKTFARIHDTQCGVCWLKLKKGQKVETIRITWKDSVQTFVMSKAQIVRPSIST